MQGPLQRLRHTHTADPESDVAAGETPGLSLFVSRFCSSAAQNPGPRKHLAEAARPLQNKQALTWPGPAVGLPGVPSAE